MNIEVGPLKLLIERTVIDVGTEIATTAPLMDNDPEKILFETPLRINFGHYMLLLYNKWKFISETPRHLDDLKGQKLESVQAVSETLELRFSSGDLIQLDTSDNGFIGPEALELLGPDNFSVVWN